MKQVSFEDVPKQVQIKYYRRLQKSLKVKFREMGLEDSPTAHEYRMHNERQISNSLFFDDHGVYFSARIEKI